MEKTIKCMVLGDYWSQKSEFIKTYVNDEFPSEWVPTVMDNYSVTVMIDGKAYTLELVDVSDLSDYDRLRTICYQHVDVFIVCFSVVSPTSFSHVRNTWVPDISKHRPGTPFLIVGTRVHLRDDSNTLKKLAEKNEEPLTFESGEKLARELKAVKYMECSAEMKRGLKNVFNEAIQAVLNPEDTEPKKQCVLM